jgi:hypothetical protein
LSFADASNQVTTVSLVGGVKEGMPVGLVADHGTLAGVWAASSALDPGGWHFQHPLDQAPAPAARPVIDGAVWGSTPNPSERPAQ